MKRSLLLVSTIIMSRQLSAQNVGIGTNTPINKFTVQTAPGNFGITHTDGTVNLSTYVNLNTAIFGTTGDHSLRFNTNNTTRLTIDPTGNVGIGTFLPPYKLTVSTAGSDYGVVQSNGVVTVGTYAGNSATAADGGWYGTRSNHPLYFFTGNGDAQTTLLPSGFFGINTTIPLGTLDVKRLPSSLGTAFFQGTTYGSVFHYSTTEDIYIRGGKNGSNVLINDVAALGKVGIGTDAPADKLTVRTASNTYGVTHTDGAITAGSYVGGGAGWFGTKTNHPLYFFTNDGNAQMRILTNGQVSINGGPAVAFTPMLTVNGSLSVTYSGSEWSLASVPTLGLAFAHGGTTMGYIDEADGEWINFSDARLKDNVIPFKSVLPGVKKLEVSTYHYKSNQSPKRSFGLIAQNVAEYFPEIVNEATVNEKNNFLGIAYSKTGVIAIKAIQEQQQIIETLQNKVDQLEKDVADLKRLLRQ